MRKQLRRWRWGIKKQMVKYAVVAASFFCTLFLLIYTFYDECAYSRFTFGRGSKGLCKPKFTRETLFLNASIVSRVTADLLGENIKNVTPTSAQISSSTQHVRKRKELLEDREILTEYPVDQTFAERKAEAEKACRDLLDAALVRESHTSTGDHTTNLKFSVDHTVLPTQSAVTESAFYKKNMLQLAQMTSLSFHKLPKYFQSAIQSRKNRWVYFHRIVPSPDGPSQNKVVEVKWCPIFKAASTPWLAVFTKLSKALTNKTEAQIRHGKLGFMELARSYRLLTPRIYDKSVHPFRYSMIIVRHPFKRLLSAYRDKIERVKGRLYYYNKYSIKIIARFRKDDIGPVGNKRKDNGFSLKVPTFHEFVQYVLSTEPRKLDEHWRPIFLDCNPCHRAFDFILKVETLNEDKDKVMQHLHLTPSDPQYKEVEDVWVRWNNPSGINQPRRNESFYYSQLSTDDMEKLYNLYEPDFRIFDYSPDSYFLMTMGVENPVV